MAHGVAEVERALAPVPALAGESGGELAGQRVERLLQRLHLVADGVHELDVLGQRLAQRLGHRLGAAIGDQPAADLGLDLGLELLDAVLVLLFLEALLERRELAADLLPGGLHQLLEHPVEVEVAQRAVEVVGAADGAAGLHPGEALHRLAGHRPHHRLVAVEQRLHQHLGDLLGVRLSIAPPPRRRAPRPAHLLLHLAPHLVEVGLVAVDAAGTRARAG